MNYQVGDKVEIGIGAKWHQFATIVRIGKKFKNGKTQLYVDMKVPGGILRKCFNV
jgi:hypothetical protein